MIWDVGISNDTDLSSVSSFSWIRKSGVVASPSVGWWSMGVGVQRRSSNGCCMSQGRNEQDSSRNVPGTIWATVERVVGKIVVVVVVTRDCHLSFGWDLRGRDWGFITVVSLPLVVSAKDEQRYDTRADVIGCLNNDILNSNYKMFQNHTRQKTTEMTDKTDCNLMRTMVRRITQRSSTLISIHTSSLLSFQSILQ